MSGTEAGDQGVDGRQDGVHRSEEGSAEAVSKERLGDCPENANGGVDTDLLQGLLDGDGPGAVDDLGGLHDLTGSHIESGHVAKNITIPNYQKKMSSHGD